MSDAIRKQDIRWRQRFQNFNKAFSQLSGAAALAQQRPLSELEQQGLTRTLGWNRGENPRSIPTFSGGREGSALRFASQRERPARLGY